MLKTTQHLYNLEIAQALHVFKTSVSGLATDEVVQRQARYGPNSVQPKKPDWLKRLIEPFANAFVLVLLFALGLSLFEQKMLDATIIAVIVTVNAIIYYFQQFTVGRVLKTLQRQDVSMASVVRAGEIVRVPSEQLTYGDIVCLEEGMKVPADGRIIESTQVKVDESMLTGESLPVHKHAGAIEGTQQVYDRKNMLFKGTYVKSGNGLFMVSGIGNDTVLGGITTLASQADIGRSPIEHKIDRFTQKLIISIVVVALVALALSVYRGTALEEALRFSLVIVVSAVPEGLPVALTVVLLLSARRMARANALVKKISSIETLGAITLIATDKTGTITQNQLSVADKHTTHRTTASFDEVISASVNGTVEHAADSLDRVLISAVKHIAIPPSWRRIKDIPFNQQLRMSGVLWKHAHGFSLYVKGAPEQVLARCGIHHRSDKKIKIALQNFTGQGYRTIAFAHKDIRSMPHKLDHSILNDMDFDGSVGMADTLRPKVNVAVAAAHNAGVKVVMLTGDHVNTAGFIGKRVGIARNDSEVHDSAVLAGNNPEDIHQALETVRVFGRVLPEHKYALLKATKGREITAMTGDGVNDVPALVEADVGIAMGSGSDVARDAADIVLLDDNFHTIIAAMRAGRTALANIRKMLVYLLGTSLGEAMTLIFALVFNIPLPVVAIQILWINLVTDGISVIPLGLSPSEPRQMLHPPQSPAAPLLNVRQVTRIITIAVVMSVSVLIVFKQNLHNGLAYAQTLAFLSLIVVQWANALNVNVEYRSWLFNFIKPNKRLWMALGFSFVLQIFVFMTPLGAFLHVESVMWRDAMIAIIAPSIAVLVAVDIHKLAWHFIAKTARH